MHGSSRYSKSGAMARSASYGGVDAQSAEVAGTPFSHADLQLLSPPPVEMLGSLLTVSGTLTFSGKIVTAYYLGVSHYLTNGLIKY